MPSNVLFMIFFQIFTFSPRGQTAMEQCSPINPHPTVPGSTSTWHLEVTGADLAKERLAKDPRRKTVWSILHDGYSATAPTVVPICRANQFSTPLELGHPYYQEALQKIINEEKNQTLGKKSDSTEQSPAKNTVATSIKHANIVRSAMAGPLGASLDDSTVHSIMYADRRADFGTPASRKEEKLELLKVNEKTRPRVLNRSLYFDHLSSEEVRQYLALLDDILVVASAGNEDVALPTQLLAKNGFTGIIAGSLDINGTQMEESNYTAGEQVLYAPGREILAQSGVTISQIGPKAGTSISAPLITGSLINAFSINEDLTGGQMREILFRTSLHIKPKKNIENADSDPQQINSYKLYRVAERLLDISKKLKISFPEKRLSQLMSEYIKSPAIYDFSSEAKLLIKRANEISPTSCQNKMSRYHLIREAYLLDPVVSTQLQLIEAAESAGLGTTALYFSSFRPAPARK